MTAAAGLRECRAHHALMAGYTSGRGVSADAYDSEPRWYAMAEDKHLSALAAMRPLELLRNAASLPAFGSALERLCAGPVLAPDGCSACGLGFAYGLAPADEPYRTRCNVWLA